MSTAPDTSMYKYAKDAAALREIEETIRQNPEAFRQEGVVSVSAGYKAVGGWLTRKPAIVVAVERKSDDVPADRMLPTKFGPFAVDVRQASPAEILRARRLREYAALAETGRKEFTLPKAAEQFNPATGERLPTDASLAEHAPKPQKPRMQYEPAPDASLDEIDEPMSLVCHASPDAGWLELSDFFGGVQSRLTVGIYDFTSAHVLEGLAGAMRGKEGGLKLVIDHPPRNPSADQTDEETVAALGGDDGLRTDFAWALVRSSRMAPRWIYPTAYHIKVAVRDGSSVWLSSGNWNNSNQPDIDPWNDRERADSVAKRSDRDWHIVVNHEGLSQTFEAFLEHDLAVAQAAQAAPGPLSDTQEDGFESAGQPAPPELAEIVPAAALEPRPPSEYFRPLRVPENGGKKRIRIQPLLTPDNYCEHVLPLIQSARTSFYMQTQYIHPSDKASDQKFADLINALVELQQNGLDVRVILSEYAAQGGWLDKMQAVGIDLSAVRIQEGVHNKGIVVDSRVVMLSSHNWSADGVLRNRDAGLIIHDEEVARYYERIFLHDWKHLAAQSAVL